MKWPTVTCMVWLATWSPLRALCQLGPLHQPSKYAKGRILNKKVESEEMITRVDCEVPLAFRPVLFRSRLGLSNAEHAPPASRIPGFERGVFKFFAFHRVRSETETRIPIRRVALRFQTLILHTTPQSPFAAVLSSICIHPRPSCNRVVRGPRSCPN